MTDVSRFDPVVHAPARLQIMAVLVAYPVDGAADFKRLRSLLALTDGNLGSHVATSETAGLVEVRKDFVGKRPRTRIAATTAGRARFAGHVAALRAILDVLASASDQCAEPVRYPAGRDLKTT